MNQTELRSALSLASIYLMRMLGLFMIMPVIAVLAPQYPDYSPLLVGLAIGGYGLTQAVMQIPMGMWSDKIGRKPIIVLGLALFALGSVVAAIAETMTLVVIGRILQGAGAIAGAVMALAGDVSRENQRAKVMAIIGIAIGFSFYLAMILGPVIAGYSGLSGIFSLTAILALLGIPLVLFGVPKGQTEAPKGDTLPVLNNIKKLISDTSLWRLNLSVMLLHMLITLIFVQVPVLFKAQGWELNEHWSLYLPILLASIVGLVVLMGLKRRVAGGALVRASIILMGLACAILFSLHADAMWLLGGVWLFFCGFNYLEANFPALVSSIAPAGQKGSAMGIYASFQFFGAFLGGVVSGVVTQYFSAEAVFATGAGICLLWLGLLAGFTGMEHLKRYALAYPENKTPADLEHAFSDLPGVSDFSINEKENTVYLKVDSQVFDLQKAQQLVGTN
ncbi:MFS transporter [Alteromonas sp. a30]|uniref:MFS transporter n=1 Tax=Alteromonas sp. a30 TaxID=2730917 RepID=UPI002281CE9D|nr:MFS transporter [Alteromonas sp. a30]MCY7294995.1 MFS transporter [Alteromonas sp. a30]